MPNINTVMIYSRFEKFKGRDIFILFFINIFI